MKTKKNSYEHTRDRLKERYGISIDLEEYNVLCDEIKKNRAYLVAQEKSHHQEIYMVKYNDCNILLVWCTDRQIVKTALPENELLSNT